MKASHLVSLLQDQYTTCELIFKNVSGTTSKNYIYKVKRATNLEIGDKVVVLSPYSSFAVGYIVAVHAEPNINLESDFDYKWIVQKIDTTEYDAILLAETQAIQILQEVEREKVREQAVKDIRASLKRGSKAAKLFSEAEKLLK